MPASTTIDWSKDDDINNYSINDNGGMDYNACVNNRNNDVNDNINANDAMMLRAAMPTSTTAMSTTTESMRMMALATRSASTTTTQTSVTLTASIKRYIIIGPNY